MSIVTVTQSVPQGAIGQALFILRAANLQSTADQQFAKQFAGTKYRITDIVAVQKSGGASVTCAGGVYDAASKGGNALIAATQSWVTLAAGVNVVGTLAAVNNTAALTATPYLSLTTGSTAACTADLFIFGYVLD